MILQPLGVAEGEGRRRADLLAAAMDVVLAIATAPDMDVVATLCRDRLPVLMGCEDAALFLQASSPQPSVRKAQPCSFR